MSIINILVGIVIILWGADKFTDGASSIARRLNVPQIVIGLTIVAFGTSMPEFCVSLTSALKGSADIAVGNIVGSNIFNALLIVGCAAVVSPMLIQKNTVKKDVPFALVSSIVLAVMCFDSELSRFEAILLLVGFALFMVYTLRIARKGEAEESDQKVYSTLWSIVFIVVGLGCLIVGSQLFVDGATEIAQRLHVSEAVIGLTIVAGGTSLPELATSVVSARKGQSGIAIGNVIGSNIFNILMILGLTGVITPLHTVGLTSIDMVMLVVSMLLVWGMSYTKYLIERWEGVVLILVYGGYLTWLIYNAVHQVWS